MTSLAHTSARRYRRRAHSTRHVHLLRYGFQVVGVRTGTVPTKVIYLITVWYGSVEFNVSETVSILSLAVSVDHYVPVISRASGYLAGSIHTPDCTPYSDAVLTNAARVCMDIVADVVRDMVHESMIWTELTPRYSMKTMSPGSR